MATAMDRWRPGAGLMRGRARSPILPLAHDMDEMLDRVFSNWPWPRWAEGIRGAGPALDMLDRKEEIILRADLPGLEQKDIEVNVDQGMLTLRGERKEDREVKEDDYYCAERWTGSFARSVTLPPDVDSDKVQATFKNGVLEIHVPKTKAAKGKRVEIKAA